MNNIVLQKLITAHNLIPDGGILSNKDGYEFHKSWKCQQYMMGFDRSDLPKHVADKYENNWAMNGPIMFESLEDHGIYQLHDGGLDFRNLNKFPDQIVKATLKENAKNVSQAAKFYLDLSGPDQLEPEEIEKIIPELKIYLPYKKVFLQVETPDVVHNILIHDHYEDLGELNTGKEKAKGFMSCSNYIYVKNSTKGPYFLFDPNTYNLTFHKDRSWWLYEINGQGTSDIKGDLVFDKPYWQDFLDLRQDPKTGNYINQGLEDHAQMTHACFLQFMILLQYPQITRQSEIKGRGDVFLDRKIRHTTSELRRQPKFTHKVLRLDLYGNDQQKGGVVEEGKGVAFHSVRKHLRRLANGKLTWVKAHFRGSKDHGTIFKDYNIDPTKPVYENNSKIN
tara:strand:+ start:711 stop:1889 length:1179 start_codon:yes stop_codon:yes gene_type:complete